MSSNFSRTEEKSELRKQKNWDEFHFSSFDSIASCVLEGERSTVAAAAQLSQEECVL